MDRLAEYLVELRGHTALSLTNQEANTIIALWQNLDDRDKQRVVYAARHQKRLLSGRFRVPKMPTQTPGVESTTRSVLVQAAHLLSGLTVAVWWRPPSSGFALFTKPQKKRQGNAVEMVSDPPRLQKDKAACTGNSLVMGGTSCSWWRLTRTP